MKIIEFETQKEVDKLIIEFSNTDYNNKEERKRIAQRVEKLEKLLRNVRMLIYYKKQRMLRSNCIG